MDDIMQRANDTGLGKDQGNIIHVPVDGKPMNVSLTMDTYTRNILEHMLQAGSIDSAGNTKIIK